MITDIKTKVEALSESLVLCEPTDLSGLAEIHAKFEEIGLWAQEKYLNKIQELTQSAADLVENIILQETDDPAGAMEMLGQSVAVLQAVLIEGRSEAEVDFPDGLNKTTAAPPDGKQVGAGLFAVTLPSHVDEGIFSDFLIRQETSLEEMEQNILAVERGDGDTAFEDLRRQIHTLKGESALLGLPQVERLCHKAEDDLSDEWPPGFADRLLRLKDWLKRVFDHYAGKGAPPESPDEMAAVLEGRADTAATATMGFPAEEVAEEAEDGYEAKPLEGDKELLGDFIIEATEHLENADVQLLSLETEPHNQDAINAVFRAFHTIKGVAGFLALDEIQALAHEAENLLDKARKDTVELVGPCIDIIFDAVDSLKKCIDNVNNALASGEFLQPVAGLPALVKRIKEFAPEAQSVRPREKSTPPPPRLGELLVDTGAATESAVNNALAKQTEPPQPKKLGEVLVEASVTSSKRVSEALDQQHLPENKDKKMGELLVEMGAVDPADIEAGLARQQTPPTPPKLGETLVKSGDATARDVAQALRTQKQGKTGTITVREAVKVDADRLDQLVDMIGELVIAESMVAQSPEFRNNISTDLERHLSQLDKITRELQVMAMSLRMVPVRSTFQKMARLVRDLAKKTNKAVNFIMTGEDTELDKTVVDKIGDPLVHMVRNAVDHGLENNAEERRSGGKEPIANVSLRAFHKGGNIHIQIEDDGRGLNRDAILQKARDRNIINEGDILSDREVWNLIFEPGFSTAREITAVSGRGVGMDVVKRNIESLRGQVEIHSEMGKGTLFTIRLPLTLAIIDGMVIRVGEERYVLPTLSIVISLRPESADITTVVGRGEMLRLQGKLIPLFRLHQLFDIPQAQHNPLEGTVVVVENDGKQVGLLIDEILGQQQIVIKSVGESLKDVPGIAGGAIMPDGRVGLILDIAGLIQLVDEEMEQTTTSCETIM